MDFSGVSGSIEVSWEDLLPVAVAAGEIILTYFDSNHSLTVMRKADHSPVTQADQAASNYIVSKLSERYPDIPCLSEESAVHDADACRGYEYYWCIDPLDGTRGFIVGDPYFTVNIALMVNHQPVLGVIYAPVMHELYYGCTHEDQGAFFRGADEQVQRLTSAAINWDALRILSGKYSNKKRVASWLERFKNIEHIPVNMVNMSNKDRGHSLHDRGTIHINRGPQGNHKTTDQLTDTQTIRHSPHHHRYRCIATGHRKSKAHCRQHLTKEGNRV